MKRRNIDNAKLRRTLKKNRMSEGFCSSSLIYLKILFVWAFVMMVDFLLDFRFEYFWPSWLLLRSIYDSFRYQGVAFSVFFVCVTVTSDMICFIFVPVQWLFFLAGTCVWVQYVWHADRGICLPTVTLWLLFIYVEASVRLKELKTLPFTLDICRPFAAHCIGYPVVTLGFGVKTYVSYRLRWRKQREVAKENEIYTQLLREALPVEQQHRVTDGMLEVDQHKYFDDTSISNGNVARCPSSSALQNSAPFFIHDGHSAIGAMTALSSSVGRGSAAENGAILRRRRKFSTLTASMRSAAIAAPSSNDSLIVEDAVALSASSSTSVAATLWRRLWTTTTHLLFDGDDPSSSSTLRWSRGDFDDNIGGGAGFCHTINGYGSPPTSWLSSSAHYDVAPSMVNGDGDSDDESGGSKDSADGFGRTVVAQRPRMPSRVKHLHAGANVKSRRPPSTFSSASNAATSPLTMTSSASSAMTMTSSSPTVPNSTTVASPQHQQLLTKDVVSLDNVNMQQQKVQDKDKDLYAQLEVDMEKLRADLRTSRNREQDLRRQINDLASSEKSFKNETQQLKGLHEQLQTKYQNLIKARQQDKENVSTLEKRVCEEQKLKNQLEALLKQEKKQLQKKLEDAVSLASNKSASLIAATNKSECTDLCKQRRRELEQQVKLARRDAQLRDEQLTQCEQELAALRQYKEANQVEALVSALNGLRDKNQHLEASLSAETRIKLDLFSALGDARRQLEIITVQHARKEQELDDLRRRLNQMNVCPTASLFNGACAPCGQQLTPPLQTAAGTPTILQQQQMSSASMDQQPAYDVLSQQIYSAPYAMSSMNGLMFDECGMTYSNMPFVPMVNTGVPSLIDQQQPQQNMSMRYSPSRTK